MRIFIFLLSLIIFDKGCSDSKINQDTLSIEYSALSRGYYKHITMNNKEITVINKRNIKPITKTCSEKIWEDLISILKTVDIENIPNLKPPTQKRLYDGAAIANLKITHKGSTYETVSFDHGNPPRELEALINKILSVSENIE